MTVKEVEEKLHITRANVRFYEKEGLFVPNRNPVNGYRDYTEENMSSLQKIIFLRNLDVSIEDIRKLQEKKVCLPDLLEKQIALLRAKRDWTEDAISVCQGLLQRKIISWAEMIPEEIEVHTPVQNPDHLIRDSLTILAQVKEVWIPWLIVALSIIVAVISYPLLPETVATDWSGMSVIRTSGKWIVLIFPFIELFIVRITKEGGLMMFKYENFGPYTIYVHDTMKYVTAFVTFIPFSWQIYIVLFQSGIKWPISIDMVLISEVVIFMVGFLTVVLYQKKKYSVC